MTTTVATSMISKNSTTRSSLVPRYCRGRLTGMQVATSGDLDLDLVNAGTRWGHDGVAAAESRQCAHPPGPGAAKNRKSPVADATTSAVNSSELSSSRTNAPPTVWPAPSMTRPVITVSFCRSTPAGMV
jgi:hypothetical protein